mgnify:CR=1 FL=1
MPIARKNPDAEVIAQPAPIAAESIPYKGISVDHSVTPVESLLAYVEGMPWTVNYYSQLLGEHNNIQELDPGQNAAFQQYQKINSFELRVLSALDTSYDESNGITSVSGSAIVTCLTPNVNDYFVSDAGSSEEGLFRIKSVSRKTFNRESVYQVDYDLVGYTRTDKERYDDICAKVVREFYFSKDRLVEGLSPLLKTSDYEDSLAIERSYHMLIQAYFSKFMNRARMLLLVPGQDKVIYDSRLVNFLEKIIDSSDAKELRDLRQVSLDHERWINQDSIWSLLINRDYTLLPFIHQKSTLVDRKRFSTSSWMAGAVFWMVDSFIYPVIDNDPVAIEYINGSASVVSNGDLVQAASMESAPNSQANLTQIAGAPVPLIKSVLIDDFYILSSEFYSGGTNLSVLEILIKDYLKCQAIDRTLLKILIDHYKTWPPLEQFYYGPFLILLCKECIRGYYR